MGDLPKLNNAEIARYSRHLILDEVGMEGQQKLKAAKVLCVGTGGLGSPTLIQDKLQVSERDWHR